MKLFVTYMTAQIDKVVKFLWRFIAAVDDVRHIWCEHERGAISLEISEHLSVAKEFPEIDMK